MEGLTKTPPRLLQAARPDQSRAGCAREQLAIGGSGSSRRRAPRASWHSRELLASASSPLLASARGRGNAKANTNNNNDNQDQRSSDDKHNYMSLAEHVTCRRGERQQLNHNHHRDDHHGCHSRHRLAGPASAARLVASLGLLVLVASACLLEQLGPGRVEGAIMGAGQTAGAGSGDEPSREPASRAALEAELNSILKQHEPRGANDKELAEAIFSRLMLGNVTGAQDAPGSAGGELDLDSLANGESILMDADQRQQQLSSASTLNELTAAAALEANESPNGLAGGDAGSARPSGPDSVRLKKLLNYLGNAEIAQLGGLNAGQVFSQFPVLPAGQAATIKRASAKMSNLLLRGQHQNQRQLANGLGRTFDFGLGKRPDSSVSSNILRIGDSSLANIQTVSGQLGKRPAHRYDFGLGKRVASPAYPRYDFGLGKRAPNRIRYDFGLGK